MKKNNGLTIEGECVVIDKNGFFDNNLNRMLMGSVLIIFLALILGGITYMVNKKITDDSLSPERIQGMTRLVELQERQARLSSSKEKEMAVEQAPIYLAENFSGVRSVDYARPTQRNCDSSPPIGWEKWFADGRFSITDEHSSKCMDITLPVAGHYEIPFHLFRRPEAVSGKFTVTANDGKCNTEESNDKCLSFVREHLQQKLIFEGKRIFIQPAPLDRSM